VRFHRAPLWTNLPFAPYAPEMTVPLIQPTIPTWRKGRRSAIPTWLFDFKYDGFGGLCYIEEGRCRFISRNGNVLNRFEALADQLAGHARR
jgi:ATP-dependent DNA ligase